MSVNVYELVTNRIIEQLENGVIPWEKPWSGTLEGAFNRISKKPYSLLNQMLLLHDGEYATFNQWKNLGGKVRKGEKSEIVVFWKIQPIEETKEDGEKTIKQIPLLRYYNIFHISQVDGVKELDKKELNDDIEPIEQAENVINDYKTREHLQVIETLSNKAFYSPTMDYVQVPQKEQYQNINEYYSTLFHELIHSTMHKSRLNRVAEQKGLAHFGNEEYSKEELIAEIGSTTILSLLGIETTKTFKNSTAYIQSWLRVLRNDNKFIVSASSKSEKAVKYIMNIAE